MGFLCEKLDVEIKSHKKNRLVAITGRVFYLIQGGLPKTLNLKLELKTKICKGDIQPVNCLLVVRETSYFSNIFCQSNYLVAITVFVIIPDIQDDIFSVI
jgi:hypothetical protein